MIDSFLASWIKQKFNSAWVLTMTVACPSGGRSDFHTFVIAIGPSKASHHNVVAHALKEIHKLRTPKLRYCGKTNTFIYTAFDIIAYLSDRPERNHLTFTSLLGAFSKRFQWASFCDEQKLPSCPRCFMKRVKEVFGIVDDSASCNVCADWDFQNPEATGWKESCTLQKVFEKHSKGSGAYPSSNFCPITPPQGRSLPERSHLRPVKQTFEWLIAAIKLSFWMVAIGKWFKYVFDSYLRTCGINKEMRERCFQSARSLKTTLTQLSEAEKQSQLTDMITTQHLVTEGIIPECWVSGCSMRKFIDVPM